MNRTTQQSQSENHSLPAELSEPASPRKKTWTPPQLTELPRLNELTLQSGGIPGGGGTGGGGSTVVP